MQLVPVLFSFFLSLNIEYSKRLCNNITIEDCS